MLHEYFKYARKITKRSLRFSSRYAFALDTAKILKSKRFSFYLLGKQHNLSAWLHFN